MGGLDEFFFVCSFSVFFVCRCATQSEALSSSRMGGNFTRKVESDETLREIHPSLYSTLIIADYKFLSTHIQFEAVNCCDLSVKLCIRSIVVHVDLFFVTVFITLSAKRAVSIIFAWSLHFTLFFSIF